MNRTGNLLVLRLTVLLFLVFLVVATPALAATVTIVNGDSAGEGFNDPTVVAALPGNSGTTLGAQRLNAFQAAANQWGSEISSSVEILVYAVMDPLPCNASAAVLGAAGPNTVFAGFPSAPVANTWYPAALANSIEGSDLCPGPGPCGFGPSEDIDATFNSTLDTGTCLGGATWWYGVGGAPPPGQLDFVETVRHELGHGLGFSTLVDLDPGNGTPDGEELGGLPDIYETFLEDHSTGTLWPAMATDGERAASAVDDDLHWTGGCVTTRCGSLSAGTGTHSHIDMYSPNPLEPGSSVAHWDTTLVPDELMEPFDTPTSDHLLTRNLLKDLGWSPVVVAVRSAGDVNGNGFDDIAALVADFATGDDYVYIMDGDSGAQIKQLALNAAFYPVDLEIVPNFAGTGADEVAVLMENPATEQHRIFVFDASSGALLNNINLGVSYETIDLEIVADFAGTAAFELAALRRRRDATARVRVTLWDASSGAALNDVFYFGTGFVPVDLEIVSSYGGTAADELAVLGRNCGDNRVQVLIRDASDFTIVGRMGFGDSLIPVDMEIVPNIGGMTGTSADEIAVLGRRPSDGTVNVKIRDAQNTALLNLFGLKKDVIPIALGVAPHYGDSPADEIVVLQEDGGAITAKIRDASTGTLVNNVFLPGGTWIARDMAVLPDIDGNSIAEVTTILVNRTNNETRALIKDATNTTTSSITIP